MSKCLLARHPENAFRYARKSLSIFRHKTCKNGRHPNTKHYSINCEKQARFVPQLAKRILLFALIQKIMQDGLELFGKFHVGEMRGGGDYF